MANKKISDLTSATTPLDGTESVELVQTGSSVKSTVTAVRGRAILSAYSTADQTGNVAATTSVIFGTQAIETGITVATDGVNDTRITFTDAGTYAVMPRLQFSNSDAADQDVTVWLRLNGTNIANTSTIITVPKTGDGGKAFFSATFFVEVTALQYVTVEWLPENVAVTIEAIAAGAIAPAMPSANITAMRVY